MEPVSIAAIYLLFWSMSALMMLSLGIKSDSDVGNPMVPGQAEGAPANFMPWLVIKRATILATIGFLIFFLNYHYGWITLEDIPVPSPA